MMIGVTWWMWMKKMREWKEEFSDFLESDIGLVLLYEMRNLSVAKGSGS